MLVLGIDPGPKESAWVSYSSQGKILGYSKGKILGHDYQPNEHVISMIANMVSLTMFDAIVIEWIEGYGKTVGKETFETCRWSGAFWHASGMTAHFLGRKAIKLTLCDSTQAKDKDIRAALIDRFGEPGTKKQPGPTYGIVGDEWAALACAVTWSDLHAGKE